MTIFESVFGAGLNPEDRVKAEALVRVVTKSTCSLDDSVKLADALGLVLQISAFSKPKPKDDPAKEEA